MLRLRTLVVPTLFLVACGGSSNDGGGNDGSHANHDGGSGGDGSSTGGDGGSGNGSDGGSGNGVHGHFFDVSDPSQEIPSGPLSQRFQSSVIDTDNGRVLVVGNSPGNSLELELDCRNLDGTACTTPFALLSSDALSGSTPSAAIDHTSTPATLVVASDDGSGSGGLRITRCALNQPLDAAHCTHALAAATDMAAVSSLTPALAIDASGKTLLVATSNKATGVQILRCALDGSGCARASLPSAVGQAYTYPQIAIDTAKQRVVVAYSDTSASTNGVLSLASCPLATTGFGTCATQVVSATDGSGVWPTVAFDATSGAILTAAENDAQSQAPSFYRCLPATTTPYACTAVDLSSLAPAGSGYTPWITSTATEILMVTMNTASSFYPWLFRCALDGTGCSAQDWSGDNAPVDDSGYFPVALVNQGELYIVSHWLNQAPTRIYVPVMVRGAL